MEAPIPIVPDFGNAAADYARYRQGFPPEFYDRIATLGAGLPGQRVLDIGTGTGLAARAFAARGCVVTGLDPSAELLSHARIASPDLHFIEARAEATGLPDASFDLISACSVWHWLDRPAASREVRRLLAPGGRLLIANLDWHVAPGNVMDVTGQEIQSHRGDMADASIGALFHYPDWAFDLVPFGFPRWEAFASFASLHYTHAAWRGRIRASANVVRMAPDVRARFDAALDARLWAAFPEDPMAVEHHIFAMVAPLDPS
ncbi:MAG TPA: methyltransferase domain-containing protein [Rhizomicrobium sp.]